MVEYAKLFTEHMDSEGIKYTVQKEHVVKVVYTGENKDDIAVFVIFDEDGDAYVQFKCWDIEKFKGKRENALAVCNSLNAEYRWVKFYIDDEDDIVASIDAMIDYTSCGKECLMLVHRVVSIVDEAYPQIAKARWA